MTRIDAPVLLVGSIPGENAEQAMRSCAEGLGERVGALPDGETGFRRVWICFLAAKIYDPHPDLETVRRPAEGWIPSGYDDAWFFKVREGCDTLRFPHLGYAEEAKRSYEVFARLRKEGVIPPGVRFQVSLPLTESAFRMFSAEADDFDAFWSGYEEAMGREIETLVSSIPAEDLLIQWDVCIEVLAIEVDDYAEGVFLFKAPGDPFERYVRAVRTASAMVPDEIPMGLHLCYGDLGHRHFVEPKDLSLVVRMANAAREAVARPIDFVHLPVPRDRTDADYMKPLGELETEGTKLYLGLVHHTDGVDGTMDRVRQARAFCEDFGIATECGFGRRPTESMPELLRIHREVAAGL